MAPRKKANYYEEEEIEEAVKRRTKILEEKLKESEARLEEKIQTLEQKNGRKYAEIRITV